MRARELHPWNVSPREAVAIQRLLAGEVLRTGTLRGVRCVAGADISWDRDTNTGHAGVIVFDYPGLEEIERASVSGEAPFPYVPGLLSFREAPLLLKVFERLATEPDVIFIDGHGLAHPRRFGVASHLGLLLDKPTIGCGKSRLTGEYREPALKRGSPCALRDKGETIGSVLRTRDGVKPVFVSIGHRVSLTEAVRFTLSCSDGYRIPRPTRRADQFVGELRRSALEGADFAMKF